MDADTLAGVLDGVLLDVAPVALQANGRWQEAAGRCYDARRRRRQGGRRFARRRSGRRGGARRGAAALDEQLDAVAWGYRRLGADRPALRVVTVDGTRFHDAGASDGQELGCTIAAAVEYLRALDARGVDPADAIGRIELRLAATSRPVRDDRQVPRRARSCGPRVAEVVGAPQADTTPVHAVTSTAMMTSYDPWVNALRSTVACFAAGVGGADAVTVLPHDHLHGAAATELGRRIGRNTQSILLRRVAPRRGHRPGRGSWYVERSPTSSPSAAWAWFQEIEAPVASWPRRQRPVAERLAARRARASATSTPRAPLTGAHRVPEHRRVAAAPRRAGTRSAGPP